MNIQLKEITPNKKNPRFIRDEQFEKLKRSVAQFPAMLEKRGLAVRKQGKKWEAIGGNMRLRALTDLEQEIHYPNFVEMYSPTNDAVNTLWSYFNHGVPCVDCSDFTPAEVQRFVIADNVPFGEWDTEVLANEWDMDDLGEWGLEFAAWESTADYSEKNKEIDVSGFSDLMELKFKFEQNVYSEVKDKLLLIGETIEDGLLKLLENVSA